MRLVAVESPLRGDYEGNRAYACACMRDCLMRGEAPFASHLLYDQPGILDDTIPHEREHGIQAGYVWADHAESVAVYLDRGMSEGMKRAVDRWLAAGKTIEYRRLNGEGPADAAAS